MKEKADSVYSFFEEDEFLKVGIKMSIRAFIDHILSRVYIRVGLGGDYNDFEVGEWL